MENQKKTDYDQESHDTDKQPWTPDYQNPTLKEDSDNYLNVENDEIDDPAAPLYPDQNRNIIDSNSALDINEDDAGDDDDDHYNEEVFEEDGDFEEKDIDYREKKERDSF
jgi:hypothetical protein